jgi:TonB family protein
MPGIRSEKEADAGSKEAPVEIVLGRPAAGKGLEIITKRPKRNPFSLFTRTTAMPGNPVIEVKFGRDGRVVSAKIVRSSGVADVDDPVIAAVYGWTARGKQLASLPAQDPTAGISITVTILIR